MYLKYAMKYFFKREIDHFIFNLNSSFFIKVPKSILNVIMNENLYVMMV